MALRASNLTLELLLPLDLRDTKNEAASEFAHRYRILNKREPSWPAAISYDAVTLAIRAASVPGGWQAYLGAGGKAAPVGLSGPYDFAGGKLPGEVAKVTKDSAQNLP
jgi:ABC-type branched-subunit amino acid transport system substrate-binding protein